MAVNLITVKGLANGTVVYHLLVSIESVPRQSRSHSLSLVHVLFASAFSTLASPFTPSVRLYAVVRSSHAGPWEDDLDREITCLPSPDLHP